jgi:3-dehydroquinate synthase class II
MCSTHVLKLELDVQQVGSFARAFFLVHSECLESSYVASRPFRVNAGPVHAYVSMAGGRTAYLAELHTGSQVLVVDAQGRSRPVLVGRAKIESRPLLLVEVEVEGQRHSVLLQNAETVCLVTSAGACCLQQCDISKQ